MIIFIDGFDKYGTLATGNGGILPIIAGDWTGAANGTSNISLGVNPLSATGYAVKFGGQNYFNKTFASQTTVIAGCRFQTDLSGNNGPFVFLNTATAVGGVYINTAGNVVVVGLNATVITTLTAGIVANSTHYLEVEITFGTSGSYSVWLDGVLLGSGTGAFGNASNTSFNVLRLGNWNNSNNNTTIDDLYVDDGTGSALNTNPVVETHLPTGDSSVTWAQSAQVFGDWMMQTSNNNAPGANELFMRRFQAPVNGTLQSVSAIAQATSSTAKTTAVIYADNAGSPNGEALIASGTQVIGTTGGQVLTSSFASPPTLVSGTYYWIGFITDTSVALYESIASPSVGVKAANTYTSGAPATCPTVSTGQVSWALWGAITPSGGTNTEIVDVQPVTPAYLGDFNYVSDGTVGDEDLYTIGSLTANPAHIYTVAVKGYMRNSDGGVRTVSLRTKSSGTDSGGSDTGQTPATTYGWVSSYFATDPNTAAAWTTAALNAATSGMKIDS